jgi:hypothetical protein
LLGDRPLGSTLNLAQLPWHTRREWEAATGGRSAQHLASIAGQTYVAVASPLHGSDGPLPVRLQSRDFAIAPYRSIQFGLLTLGLLAALLGITASAMLARSVTAARVARETLRKHRTRKLANIEQMIASIARVEAQSLAGFSRTSPKPPVDLTNCPMAPPNAARFRPAYHSPATPTRPAWASKSRAPAQLGTEPMAEPFNGIKIWFGTEGNRSLPRSPDTPISKCSDSPACHFQPRRA